MLTTTWKIALAAACLLPAASFGGEPLPTDLRLPAEIRTRVEEVAPADARPAREKGAYLGVSTSPASAVVRKQLGLTPGMGLVVDFVVPDGPASAAGLKQYDVLQKLDDQIIINPQQLAVLVRSHQPGDEIKLGIIHEGKPAVISAKLIEHEVGPLPDEEMNGSDAGHFLRAMPAPGIRPMPGGPGWNLYQGSASSLTWIDGERSYTIATDIDGHKKFIGKEKDGKVDFESSIDTQEQRDKLPADQKEKLRQMTQHLGGSLHHLDPTKNPTTQPNDSGKDAEPAKTP